MKLFNKTKKIFVSHDVRELKTLREKIDGMIAFKSPHPIYFETRWGIHTFGVKYPIDVVVCDEEGVVKSIRKNLPPNRVFFWNPRYKRVFELPPNSSEIEIGDLLLFQK